MVHCHSQQVYEINELFDDDAVIYTQLQRVQEEYSCQHMFRFVMIPITVITIVCGILSKCLITRLYESIQQEYHLFVKILCYKRASLGKLDVWDILHNVTTQEFAKYSGRQQ